MPTCGTHPQGRVRGSWGGCGRGWTHRGNIPIRRVVQMKQYVLSIYQPDAPPPPEVSARMDDIMAEVNALVEEAKAAGAWVFNGGLHSPSTATVVRLNHGDVLMTDGPYTEGKEHIGGFLIVKAPDLDAALA